MANVLVVDDDSDMREGLEVILGRDGHTVVSADSGYAALQHLHENAATDVVVSDIKMPKMDGLSLLRHVKSHDQGIVVVMMSGHTDVAAAVEAMKEGAFDYLIKPFSREEVIRSVQKALAFRAILVENLALKRQVNDQFARSEVIGSSPAWKSIRDVVEQVAPSRATVLITGESGTGKELIANLVHRLSPRANKPFVTVNAAALPETLVEAELFGYEKGAFTGALQSKPGRFEMAHEGTLFLDEIGELPLPAQAKLLRILQEGTVERLGGTKTIRVDVRIVAATNRELETEIEAKRFREDLYYRINVIAVLLPPLRERREDIPLLIHHFVKKHAQQNQKDISAVQQDVLRRLQNYEWPGNVRELENIIERAVILASDTTIGVDQLPSHLQNAPATAVIHDQFALPQNATLASLERAAIEATLERCGGNRQVASEILDIGIATLYRKVKEYNLS